MTHLEVHSDFRVIIRFGDGGCRWDLMNKKSARCIQPGFTNKGHRPARNESPAGAPPVTPTD
jgi:hypothetical protein